MNAIEFLKQDHRAVGELFAAHEAAGENALVEKRTVADKIFKELEAHTQVEEEIFYPASREGATGDTEKLLAEAYEEHQLAKTLIAELKSAAPGNEQWDAKMKVLQESIEHHVDEEEGELFPKVRAALGAPRLEELGTMMAARKRELTTTSPSLSSSLVKLVTRAYDSLTGSDKPAKRSRPKAATSKRPSTARTRKASPKPKKGVAKKAATAAKRVVRAVTARTVSSAKKARVSRSQSVATAKKTVARAKTRVATGRARAAKMVTTARKRATKSRRSARR